MGILSLVFGIIALILSLGGFIPLVSLVSWGAILFGVAGILFALLRKKRKKDKMPATIGLWLSVAALIIVVVRLILLLL